MDSGLYTFSNFTDLAFSEKEQVWKWRNDDAIRKWMYSTDIISFENHLKFIERLENDTTKVYYLAKRERVPIGVFSIININDNEGEWGYYIAPLYHERNLGVEFYYYVLQYVFEVLSFKKIIGYALVENKAANSLNDLFGFFKRIEDKIEDGQTRKYYYRHLLKSNWKENVRINKKIIRFLQLTSDKHLK